MTSTLRIGQFRLSRLYGPIRITTFERVVHCRSVDGKTALTLSPRCCERLPVLGHV